MDVVYSIWFEINSVQNQILRLYGVKKSVKLSFENIYLYFVGDANTLVLAGTHDMTWHGWTANKNYN